MATLVLTAVGSAIGGPVGGAIGSIIGQQIDRAIFAPKPREGARLKELEVQTSSYGTQIPAIFGAMRVAGTVIWATDLIERRVKSGGGKGRPSTVNYSYSVSMAVALSSRPVARVGRIWADGNLLRGAGGDFKVDTQFRFFSGHADQPPDPLMASAEAAGQCPAHRGLAYAVFEDLQLADYGNRIPSLTFEIFERDGEVPVREIFAAASGDAVSGSSGEQVTGFALGGGSAREAVSPLLSAMPVELAMREGMLSLDDGWAFSGGAPPPIIAASENRQDFDPSRQKLQPASSAPQTVSLRYYDRERDYQAGIQQSDHGNGGRNVAQVEFPAVLDAAEAKRLVELWRLDAQNARTVWEGQAMLSPDRLYPGDRFTDEAGRKWRIEEIEHRFGSATIKARSAMDAAGASGGSANPGRNLPSPDLVAGATRLAVLDLPLVAATDPGKPQIAVFAAGTGNGWRRAALSLASEEELLDIGPTAAAATMGTALTALLPHVCYLVDETARLDIQLLNDAMDIAERAGSPLDRDAPLLWLDGEYLRYGKCEALGAGQYRFSRLLRGCFRDAPAALSHVVGAKFVMLDAATARLITEREYLRGETVTVEALGSGDLTPVAATMPVEALATTPLPPVHGMAERRADGSIVASWIRRSRADAGWRDGVDQLLVEDGEQYLVSLHADMAPVGQWTVMTSALLLEPPVVSALNLPVGTSLRLDVRQIGRHAASEPLSIPFS